MSLIEKIDRNRMPQHVAIIMDGNGRWAKSRGKDRSFGHMEGVVSVRKVVEAATELGLKYLTLYTFSTENWNRPEKEVSALMTLLQNYLKTSIKKSMKNNVRCRVIGEKSRLSADIQKAIKDLEETTAGNTGLTFTIAINYGSRDEITRAVRKVAEKCVAGQLLPDAITEASIEQELDTAFLPDPDLLIRTCGEQRISNFLLWQCAYTEFYYTDIAWPDFNKAELEKAIAAYGRRDRKYGGLEQDDKE